MTIEITEDKGSQKRYEVAVTTDNGLLNWFFGVEPKEYKVRILSRRKVKKEELEPMMEELFENKDQWEEGKKACDYQATLDKYPQVSFFIYNKSCKKNDSKQTSSEEDNNE